MKLPIPETFRLGPYDIKVRMFKSDEEADERVGTYSTRTQILRLEEGLPDATLQEVFIHEILESINRHYELEIDHTKLNTISMTLGQVIRDLKDDR